jgi:phosphatidylinositol alpha-1,6-mannosyltransferase
MVDKAASRVVLPGVDPPFGATATLVAQNTDVAPRLLTIARLEPRKGVDMVLRALAALAREYPAIGYDVIGKGDDLSRLTQLAEELGVSDRVRFHGYISEQQKAELLRNATLFLMPNRREPGSVEGFGIVFVEAAAFGVPSIAGADGGTSDAVLHGQTGLVVDGEDGPAIQAAISRLLTQSSEREQMGAAAHQRFWAEFAWPAAVYRFEDALGLG